MKIVLNKVHSIEILHFLNNQTNPLDLLSESYSNLSSVETNLKNNYDALTLGMESLSLALFNKNFYNKNSNTFLNYYTVGICNENMKRINDAKYSFYYAKKFLKDEKGDIVKYNFIKNIRTTLHNANSIIGFEDSFDNSKDKSNYKK